MAKLLTVDVDVTNLDVFERIAKDRLDFGFDSIYFRYAEVVEELSYYKEKEAHREGTHFDRKHWANGQKMHFYNCLEQLLQCHQPKEDKKK